jgi:hypothetical protein
MARISKYVILCLVVILTVYSLIIVGSLNAESIPKPSVPQFTVSLLENNSVQLSIRNQPFDVNNSYNYSFVYDVRITNSLGNWTDLYNADDGYPYQSNSDYTNFFYKIADSPSYYPTAFTLEGKAIPTNGQVTFQVKAMVGYRDRGTFSNGMMPYVFKGESSDWSNNQTITIPTSLTPTESMPNFGPTSSPIPSYNDQTITLALVVIAILVISLISLLLYNRNLKKRRTKLDNSKLVVTCTKSTIQPITPKN